MDYNKLYNQIIDRARNRKITGYAERHHIQPRSLGGSDDADNLVDLTAREHFICHYLLAKMYKHNTRKWYKMNHAFIIMKSANSNQSRYFNSRLYESLRSNFSEVMSKAQQGNNNSQFGTCWIHRLDMEQSKKIKKEDIDNYLSQGWVVGRKVDFTKKVCNSCKETEVFKKQRYCKCCKKKKRKSNVVSSLYKEKERFVEYYKSGNFTTLSKTLSDLGFHPCNTSLNKVLKEWIKEIMPD